MLLTCSLAAFVLSWSLVQDQHQHSLLGGSEVGSHTFILNMTRLTSTLPAADVLSLAAFDFELGALDLEESPDGSCAFKPNAYLRVR